MSARSSIFSKRLGTEIGYVEGDAAFDLHGRRRCIYDPATSNLIAFDSGKIAGHVSLEGIFVGLSWLADELFPLSNDMLEIESDTPIKEASTVDDSRPNPVSDAHVETPDPPRSLIGAELTVEKWLADALSESETASDRPIRETAVMNQPIELAIDSQPDIVRDEHLETPDQGGTVHITAASSESPVDVSRKEEKQLASVTVEVAMAASTAEQPDNWREKWERAKSMLDPARKE